MDEKVFKDPQTWEVKVSDWNTIAKYQIGYYLPVSPSRGGVDWMQNQNV